MHDESAPKLAKWPFYVGDILLLGLASYIGICGTSTRGPLELWPTVILACCVAGGAILSILPHLLEYRVISRLAEVGALTPATTYVQNLESVAARIAEATGRWQNVQEGADKTAAASRQIVERIETEAKAFTEFMAKANDSEKATLRLEIEKLRRGEGEWLQVAVHTLDHIHALHQGAVRSGQPNLITQMTHFQNACREVVRRVGLMPFMAAPDEKFDPRRHRAFELPGDPPPEATIAETVAPGFTFQGQMLRPALVRLAGDPVGDPSDQSVPVAEPSAPTPGITD